MSDKIEGLMPDVRKAARSTAFDWPGTVEEGDLVSDLYIRLHGSPATVDKLLEMEPGQRVYRLKRMAKQIASQARTDLDHFSGNFNYSVNEVKKYLSAGGLDKKLDQFNTQIHDLREAFKVLQSTNENYANAIYQRYVLEVPPNPSTLNRALTKISDLMNRSFNSQGSDHFTGGRVTNRAALRVTENDYDGTWEEISDDN